MIVASIWKYESPSRASLWQMSWQLCISGWLGGRPRSQTNPLRLRSQINVMELSHYMFPVSNYYCPWSTEINHVLDQYWHFLCAPRWMLNFLYCQIGIKWIALPYKSPVQLLIDPNDRTLLNDRDIMIISFISFIGTSQKGHDKFYELCHEK